MKVWTNDINTQFDQKQSFEIFFQKNTYQSIFVNGVRTQTIKSFETNSLNSKQKLKRNSLKAILNLETKISVFFFTNLAKSISLIKRN